ncbi:MAG: hypothetical protein SOU51_01130 [Collinsella sp.]|nr:hypothetical protein [Collinsella sp.]
MNKHSVESLPMTLLLKEAYEASAALGPEPDETSLERYGVAMDELDRRSIEGRKGDLHTHIQTAAGVLAARHFGDGREYDGIMIELVKPDGTAGNVALVECVMSEGTTTVHTLAFDGRDADPASEVTLDPAGDEMFYPPLGSAPSLERPCGRQPGSERPDDRRTRVGYYIETIESTLTIVRNNFDPALDALRAAPIEDWDYIEREGLTLPQALEEIGFELDVSEGGIDALWLPNQKASDDHERTLMALGPFVEPGSRIVIQGEDSQLWGYSFDGNRAIESSVSFHLEPMAQAQRQGTVRHTLLEHDARSGRALIKREGDQVSEYVVAREYDRATGIWSSGSYHSNAAAAASEYYGGTYLGPEAERDSPTPARARAATEGPVGTTALRERARAALDALPHDQGDLQPMSPNRQKLP